MRLTTKIVIGVIATIFLASFIYIFYEAATYKKPVPFDIKSLKYTSIDIPAYKKITLEIDPDGEQKTDNRNHYYALYGDISIYSINEKWENLPHPDAGKKDKLLITEELKPYLRYTLDGETLKLYIKPTNKLVKQWVEGNTHHSTSLIKMMVFVDSSSFDIQSNMERIDISAHHLHADQMGIRTINGHIGIHYCSTNSLTARIDNHGYKNLLIDHSEIKELNVHNENSYFDWNITESKIETANLSGYTGKNISIYPNTFKKVNLIRTGDNNNSINIKLFTDTTQLVFP